jgi:hypothetical protein
MSARLEEDLAIETLIVHQIDGSNDRRVKFTTIKRGCIKGQKIQTRKYRDKGILLNILPQPYGSSNDRQDPSPVVGFGFINPR